jgi:multiple sugar transport system substrate-binding protein
MKKFFVWMIVLVLSLSIVVGYALAGCKTTSETTAAGETTAASETTVASETTAAGETTAATTATTFKPGTVVNVFIDSDTASAPWKANMDKIKQLSGIDIVLTEVNIGDVYTKLKNEFVAGTGAYDLVVYSPYLVPEFVSFNNLKDLSPYLSINDPNLGDVIESFKELYCYYNNTLYALPYDGDIFVSFFRKDLINDPTEQSNFKAKYGYDLGVVKTWVQQKDFAEFFTRKAGDKLAGQTLTSNFYGNSMMLVRGWSWYTFMSPFCAYGGTYFDQDLNPVINSEAGVKALEDLIALKKFAPPDVLSEGWNEATGSFLAGGSASIVCFTDVFKMSWKAQYSKIIGKIGSSNVPGVGEGDSYYFKAPMLFGRVISIPSTSKVPEAAFWVASYMSNTASKETIVNPNYGADPYRYSQLDPQYLSTSLSKLTGTDVPLAACEEYFNAIKANQKNGFPELSIPGAAQYLDILDLNIGKALSGELGVKAALDQVAQDWNKLSDTLGRDNQKAIWQKQLVIWKKLGLAK